MVPGGSLISVPAIWYPIKIGFVSFAVLYFIFSLILIRQVSLMTETVKTELGALIRFLSVLFATVALSIVVLFVIWL